MIVLASGSTIRRQILHNAGVAFETVCPAFDEAPIKLTLRDAGADVGQIAEELAIGKALALDKMPPDHFIIGADQMLDCDGVAFDKPTSRSVAADHLRRLRGRPHRLISAVTLVADGTVRWRYSEQAVLSMRNFSDSFLEPYLDQQGDKVLNSVGGYHIEGPGAQFFEKIQGDYFTILGLPLIPLLTALRAAGALAS